MNNRTYVCNQCGSVRRLELGSKRLCHCGVPLSLLSHEQGYVATHLSRGERLDWLAAGGRVLKGRKKIRKWLPATSPSAIQASREQERRHRARSPVSRQNDFERFYSRVARQYVRANPEAVKFLRSIGAQEYIESVLFVSIAGFRREIYRYVVDYDLDHKPRRPLQVVLERLGRMVVGDDELFQEVLDLYPQKNIAVPGRIFNSMKSEGIFSLRRFLIKRGISIRQSKERTRPA